MALLLWLETYLHLNKVSLYVLPYGQMSLWGATVITNLMSAIPWVGQDIVQFIWGGFSVNNATLNRFFALHFVLPFILAALALMHLIVLHERAGSGNPLGVTGNSDRLPFAPYFIFKDLITIFVFILVISILVFYMPNVLGDSENYVMANAMQTPSAIVPEWYLLPFYAILRSIPNKLLGVIAMFCAILILLVMPFTDLSRSRGIQFRPLSKIMFFIFIANFLILLQLGSKHVESPFIEFGQISTVLYFAHFLVIIPLTSIIENSLIEIFEGTERPEEAHEKNDNQYNFPEYMTVISFLPSFALFYPNRKNKFITDKLSNSDPEAPTEPSTEAPTEPSTEPSTEAPTEPSTEPSTEQTGESSNVEPEGEGSDVGSEGGNSDTDSITDVLDMLIQIATARADALEEELDEVIESNHEENLEVEENAEGSDKGTDKASDSETDKESDSDSESDGEKSDKGDDNNKKNDKGDNNNKKNDGNDGKGGSGGGAEASGQGSKQKGAEEKKASKNISTNTRNAFFVVIPALIFAIASYSYMNLYVDCAAIVTHLPDLTGCVPAITNLLLQETLPTALCDAPKPWGIYFQDSGTPQMEALVELHDNIMFYLVIILFGVGWILISIVNVYNNTQSPISLKYLSHGASIELIWTVTPAIILILIAFPSFKLLYLMDEVSDPAMVILAEGHQWYWSFQYADFLDSSEEFVEFDSYLVPESDLENGALRMLEVDNRLIIPELTHVRFIVGGADVIHSFACPAIGMKCDAYPGRLNQSSVMINRAATFYGQCSEICGILHSSMPIVIESVSIEKFLSWLLHQ